LIAQEGELTTRTVKKKRTKQSRSKYKEKVPASRCCDNHLRGDAPTKSGGTGKKRIKTSSGHEKNLLTKNSKEKGSSETTQFDMEGEVPYTNSPP